MALFHSAKISLLTGFVQNMLRVFYGWDEWLFSWEEAGNNT
jgi:hypothetical protein